MDKDKILKITDAKFCSWCSAKLNWRNGNTFATCSECGRKLFPNHKPCTAALVTFNEQILLIRRAIEPRKGFLDLPGGFIDLTDIDAESGARRELKEELNLDIKSNRLKYLGSNTDTSYVFQDMNTFNLILYFTISLSKDEAKSIKLDFENSEFIWVKLGEIENYELGFNCYWEIIEKLRKEN